jgi:muconate cycloisomerase
LKIKVGYDSPADDVLRIRAATEAASHELFRLDANGGWDAQWAEQVLSQIPTEQIDFIEQPFARGRWRMATEFAKKFRVRLALDEEIQTLSDAQRLVAGHASDVIVLKPMVIGHFFGCFQLAQRARAAGMEVIYTSSWESDIGIAATLHLAAALGPNPPAMGLSTAGTIADGIVKTPLRIENGYLRVPEGPGLGIELAPELLRSQGIEW